MRTPVPEPRPPSMPPPAEAAIWDRIDACVERLAAVHKHLRATAAEYAQLNAESCKLFESGDKDFTATQERMRQAFDKRRDALAEVARACEEFDAQVRSVEALLAAEEGTSGSLRVMAAALEASARARARYDESVADELRKLASEVRDRVRAARRQALEPLLGELRTKVESCRRLGMEPADTEQFLQAASFLDWPIDRAEQRVRNEITLVGASLAELERLQLQRDADRIRSILRTTPTHEALEEAARLLVALLHAGHPATEELVPETLETVSGTDAPFLDRVRLWSSIVAMTLPSGSRAERLLAVADLLPQSGWQHDEEPAAAAAHLLLEAGSEDDEAREYWPLIQAAHRRAPAWAHAFFSVLWGQEPSDDALARWLLRFEASECYRPAFEAFAARQQPPVRHALEGWACAKWGGTPSEEPDPVVIAWLHEKPRVPSWDIADCAWFARSATTDVGGAAAMCTLAWLTGNEAAIRQEMISVIRQAGLLQIADLFEAAMHGVPRVRDSVNVHESADKARELLDRLNENRSPPGAPAKHVWVSVLFPMLRDLRRRAADPGDRDDALEELEDLRSSNAVARAIEDSPYKGVNPLALRTLEDWVEQYKTNVPLEVAVAGSAPDLLRARSPSDAASEELDALGSMLPLGPIAAGWLKRLLAAPWGPKPQTESLPDAGALRALGGKLILGDVGLAWRFALAPANEWLQAAAADFLDRVAGTASPAEAIREYLRAHRYDLAEDLARSNESEHGELTDLVEQAKREAVQETRDILHAVALSPLAALRDRERLEQIAPSREEDLERTIRHGAEIDAKLSELHPGRALELVDEFTARVDELLADYRTAREPMVDRLTKELTDPLKASAERRPAQFDTRSLTCAYALALQGRIADAIRAIEGESPVVLQIPAWETAQPQAGDEPCVTVLSRPHASPDVAALSRFTRDALTHAPSEVAEAGSEHAKTLVRVAAGLGRDEAEWASLLARWCVDEGFRQARELSFARACDHARDACLLLADPAGCTATRCLVLDQALSLWLNAGLHGAKLPLNREAVDWVQVQASSGATSFAATMRRFVQLRAPDILAALLLEIAAVGGHPFPRLLDSLPRAELHLRSLILAEVVKVQRVSIQRRAAAAADTLAIWLEAGREEAEHLVVKSLDPRDDMHADSMRLLDGLLRRHGVPPDVVVRLDEALRQTRVLVTAATQERFVCRLETSWIYLSAVDDAPDDLPPVIAAEVSLRSGMAPARDLKLAISIKHPVVVVESRYRIQEVGALRPNDRKDVLFPWTVDHGRRGAGETQSMVVTLELYREDEAGRAIRLVRKTAKVNVSRHYPHEDVLTPYITGKAISDLSMIKGREREVDDILAKLRGMSGENFVLIHGMRRIGKSSLLQKLRLDTRIRAVYDTAHLDLEHHLKSTDAPPTLLDKLARQVQRDLEQPKARAVEVPDIAHASDPYRAFEAYLEAVARRLAATNRRLLLLFDEFQMLFADATAPRNLIDVIKSLRHWVQYLPIGFVVAGTNELKKATLGPSQRLFQLGLTVELRALEEAAARELIRDPVANTYEVTPTAVKLLLTETGRFPNLLQIVCQNLFMRMKERQQSVATQDDVRRVLHLVAARPEQFSFLLEGVAGDARLRAVTRALAEVGVEDKRGTPGELAEHLRAHGESDLADSNFVGVCLKALAEREIILNWKGTYRLHPPLLAHHVLQREEFELQS